MHKYVMNFCLFTLFLVSQMGYKNSGTNLYTNQEVLS